MAEGLGTSEYGELNPCPRATHLAMRPYSNPYSHSERKA